MPEQPLERQVVVDAVFAAIAELNQMRAPSEQIEKSLATPLSGADGCLDSMARVNLILEVEQQLADSAGVEIDLADQVSDAPESDPLETVATLVDYIASRLQLS